MKDRLAVLNEMLENDPNDRFVLYAICLELYKLGRAEDAIERMLNLLDGTPKKMKSKKHWKYFIRAKK